MPLAAATREQVQSLTGRGMREEDFAARLLQQAEVPGLRLEPENAQPDDGLS